MASYQRNSNLNNRHGGSGRSESVNQQYSSMIVKDTVTGVVVRGGPALPQPTEKRESGALVHKINRASAKMAGKASQQRSVDGGLLPNNINNNTLDSEININEHRESSIHQHHGIV